VHEGEIRDTLAEEGWTERQVVILEPDDRRLCTTFCRNDLSEGGVDILIVAPMARPEDGPFKLEVT
jgi:hypothetical protein